jgi:LysR family glycine cleavage system transcriptional activator
MIGRRFLPSPMALQAFEAAARYESFSRAADELNLTQSAISRQVRGLELALSIRLFELVRQRVVLTKAGRLYLRDVRRILAILETSSLRATELVGGGEPIDLAVPPTFCARWLLPRLPELYAACPDISVNCLSSGHHFVFEDETFDAAILLGGPTWPGAVADHLFDQAVAAVCSPDFRSRNRIQHEADLSEAPRLHMASRPTQWANWFKAAGLGAPSPMRGARFDEYAILARAAVLSLGVALLPEFLIQDELRSGALVRVGAARRDAEQAYYLVVPESKLGSKRVARFRRWLLAQTKAFDSAVALPEGHLRRAAAND